MSILAGRMLLWRNRDFMLLWSGQTMSLLGGSMTQVALPLLVLSLTHSAGQTGIVLGLYALPYPLLGLFAGVIVDQQDRRSIMIVCEIANILAAGSIPLALSTGHLSLVQFYIVALVAGVAFVFFNVAEVAALPSVVEAEQIGAAVAQNQVTFSITGLIGPPLGGLLYGVSRALPFLADAVSYVASLGALIGIRQPFQQERTAPRSSLGAEFREALRWVWGEPAVRALALLFAGYNLINGGSLLIIVLAKQEHAEPALIGAVFSISALGAIAGALIAPWAQARIGVRGIVLVFLWTPTLIYPLFLAAPHPLILGALFAVVLFVSAASNVAVLGFRLSLIPDQLQGRVNSLVRTGILGVTPIGTAGTGFLLQTIHPTGTVWVIEAGMLLLALSGTAAGHLLPGSPRPIAASVG